MNCVQAPLNPYALRYVFIALLIPAAACVCAHAVTVSAFPFAPYRKSFLSLSSTVRRLSVSMLKTITGLSDELIHYAAFQIHCIVEPVPTVCNIGSWEKYGYGSITLKGRA
eukprot:6208564-Pleurochrysis_carterae.AAC.2